VSYYLNFSFRKYIWRLAAHQLTKQPKDRWSAAHHLTKKLWIHGRLIVATTSYAARLPSPAASCS
jgi:hypothetical protein